MTSWISACRRTALSASVLLTGSPSPAQTIEFAPPSYPATSHSFGVSVAGLGDVDGDGWGDVAVGDPGGQVVGGDRVGRVYLYSGRTHALWRSLAPPGPTDLFGVNFGLTICSLGDVDGDGRDDVAVGASAMTESGSPLGAGRVYVYSGATGDLLYTLRSEHESVALNFGLALARVPDADGDGADDLVVGSPHEAGGGAVYMFSGATGQVLRVLPSPPGCCQFGEVIAGVPDLDGDGRGDIAATTREPIEPGSDVHGVTYIFSGASGEVLHRIPRYGTALSGIGDLNSDGFGDILIAWSAGNVNGVIDHSGFVRVVSGASGGEIRVVLSPRPEPSGEFGFSLAGMDDRNGDGAAEMVVGALWERPDGQPLGSGSAYLLSGATGSMLQERGSRHPQNNGMFGACVAAVPDCNGDGRPEFVVGAPNEHFGNGSSNGRAYLFLSCPADMNADGRITSQDFFDFLNAFFAADPRADFTRDGTINSQDFFEYLNAFFEGCP
jgi:hypothetical protein